MASVTVKTYGAERKAEIRKGLRENVEEASQLLVNEVRKYTLRGSRSGRMYRIPGAVRKRYRASAPGEPPANRTGELGNSYTRVEFSPLSDLVGTPLKRGRWLERGTSRMKPRPHLMPMKRKHGAKIERILGRPVL